MENIELDKNKLDSDYEKLLAEIYKLQHCFVSQKSEFNDFTHKLDRLSKDLYTLQNYVEDKVDDVDFANLLKKDRRKALIGFVHFLLITILIFLIIRKLI